MGWTSIINFRFPASPVHNFKRQYQNVDIACNNNDTRAIDLVNYFEAQRDIEKLRYMIHIIINEWGEKAENVLKKYLVIIGREQIRSEIWFK